MRDAIVDAAVELFLAEGYENTSIRRIAEKIEYTPGAIYSYFKDKDEILFEIHKKGFDKLFEYLLPALEGADPLDRLYRTGRLYIKFALENPKYYDVMFIDNSAARTIQEECNWECGHRAYDVLRKIIAECIEGRLLPQGDIDLAAYSFWSLTHGMVSLVLRGRSMVRAEEQDAMLNGAFEYMWSAIVGKR